MYWVALAARLKYYFAWTLSESICNASGLGFNGMDEKTGQAKWDLTNNIDIFKFEVSFCLNIVIILPVNCQLRDNPY